MAGWALAFDTEERPAALHDAAMPPAVSAPLRNPRRVSLNPGASEPLRPSVPSPVVVLSSMTVSSSAHECTAPKRRPPRCHEHAARTAEASTVPCGTAAESGTCDEVTCSCLRTTEATTRTLPAQVARASRKSLASEGGYGHALGHGHAIRPLEPCQGKPSVGIESRLRDGLSGGQPRGPLA